MAGIETSLALADFTGGYAGVTVVDAARRFAVPATAAGSAFGIAPPVDLPSRRSWPARARRCAPRAWWRWIRGGASRCWPGELLVYDHLVIAVAATGWRGSPRP